MFTNLKHIGFIVGSFLGAVGPFLLALQNWNILLTPAGAGSLLVLIGAWLTALCTYSPLVSPLGAPKQ